MKIGIIGGGVVGSATARCYLEHVDVVRVYDIISQKATHSIEDTLDTDIIFVCLPTPASADGLDTSILDDFFKLPLLNYKKLVIKSTVPIGYTKSLPLPNIVHSPEFLTSRCSFVDAQIPSRNLIGCPTKGNFAMDALYELYKYRFPSVPIYLLSSDETEAIKLFTNAFFAVKVTFFNDLYQLSKKLDLKWSNIIYPMLADERIGSSHTKVPGMDGLFGFGGDCLPKDLLEVIKTQLKFANISVCAAASICNKEHRRQ